MDGSKRITNHTRTACACFKCKIPKFNIALSVPFLSKNADSKVIFGSKNRAQLTACWTCCTSMDCKLNPGTFTSAVAFRSASQSTIPGSQGHPLPPPAPRDGWERSLLTLQRGIRAQDLLGDLRSGAQLGIAGHSWAWVKMDTLKIDENWMVNG